jgi:hypothetical protein
MFQGRLVARTFLEHLQVISGIDKSQRVKERPVGALILAVQAVCFFFLGHFYVLTYEIGTSRSSLLKEGHI